MTLAVGVAVPDGRRLYRKCGRKRLLICMMRSARTGSILAVSDVGRRTTMDQQETRDDLAYMDEMLRRLLEHYLTGTSLPGNAGARVSMTLLHRLARCIVTEGYGQ